MVSTSEVVCSTNTPRDVYIFPGECDDPMAELVGFASGAAEEAVFMEEHVEKEELKGDSEGKGNEKGKITKPLITIQLCCLSLCHQDTGQNCCCRQQHTTDRSQHTHPGAKERLSSLQSEV